VHAEGSMKQPAREMHGGQCGRGGACEILVQAAVFETDPQLGLPNFIFHGREIQLLLKVWCGCYDTASAFGISENECSFLFRWFLLGGVLDNEEVETSLRLAIEVCSQIEIQKLGWSALAELFRYASQQGKLVQPWGAQCLKWIIKHKL
jgi:hypothetical protein